MIKNDYKNWNDEFDVKIKSAFYAGFWASLITFPIDIM